MTPGWIQPDWPAPPRVRALVTTRHGGVSSGLYASMNLGTHVGDSAAAVAQNRALLRRCLPAEPLWLEQVHGIEVVRAEPGPPRIPIADASVAKQASAVCAVMTADCLPVLFCDDAATVVAAAHAGWRGLAAGILDATVAQMGVAPEKIIAWMGPAIGPDAFEVGDDVRQAFCEQNAEAAMAFRAVALSGKWMADLYMLARLRLAALGIARVFGGGECTYSDPQRYFSYRRDGVTGRMASLVWLDDGNLPESG